MTRATRNGYIFETEVHKGLELAGYDVWKIPDSKMMGRVINVKAPADFIISKGHGIKTLEAKSTKLARIPWANFREHQIQWCISNPSSAYFVIMFNNRKTGAAKINETFLVSAFHINKWIEEYDKSVPLDTFRKECIELPRFTAAHNPTADHAFINFQGVEL